MMANNSKSYLGCLNKFVDEYNHSYHSSVSKKPIDVDYFALTEEIDTNPKVSSFRMGIESKLQSIRTF